MKKKIPITMFLFLILCLSVCDNVYADGNIENVSEYLSQFSQFDDTFYLEEYSNNEQDDNNLFIRVSIKSDDSCNWASNGNIILEDLSKQEWFNYDDIYCISFSADNGLFISFRKFDVDKGVYSIEGKDIRYPWIIKSEDELSSDEKRFIGRVSEELLRSNINTGVSLEIGAGGEENLLIRECGGISEVSGECRYDGKKYNFLLEFTYDMKDEFNGNYDILYIGINDIDLYGKYRDIKTIEVE